MVVRTLTISATYAAGIIGRKGNNITNIERKMDVRIFVRRMGADMDRSVTLIGRRSQVSKAVEMICKVEHKRKKVEVLSDNLVNLSERHEDVDKSEEVVERSLTVTDTDAGNIIVMKGKMKRVTGVTITVCGMQADRARPVTLRGKKSQVSKVIEMFRKITGVCSN